MSEWPLLHLLRMEPLGVALEARRFADGSMTKRGEFAEQGEFGAFTGKPRSIACPICQTTACFMATHPEADIYRCKCCTHAFSDPGSMPRQESYDPDYYNDTHRRWFEHPNTALFERITAVIPTGASVIDVGCGRGDFLRHVHRNRPDVQLTGIDYSPIKIKLSVSSKATCSNSRLAINSTLLFRSTSLNTYPTASHLPTVYAS